jgi:isopentenyl diphosphate isomerase/L-lactate dehydrogenase-like FMN-dependent dehydrogenase
MATLDNCYNIFDMREAAKRRLPRGIFEFVDRATEDHLAVTENRAGFQDIKLRHRALVDVSGRSTKTMLFGKEVSLPMIIAPTGAAGLCWYRGELQLAKAAAEAGIPFAMSTASMTAMEEVADQAGGRLWFQLYVWKRRDLSYQVIERAKQAGYEALVVTVDSAVSPNREYNARNGFSAPLKPNLRMAIDIALHPGWSLGVMGRYLRTTGMPKQENFPPEFQESITRGVGDRADGMRRDSLTWDDVKKFREMWPGLLMLKGVNRVDDALKAINYGVDGIIVSNHGGRNMDSAPATIRVLPEIAEAVGEKATVILDSGVRRGSDIVKALALGAKAVLTGRATLYGTAVAGEAGAAKAIQVIQTEMDKTMAYTGCNRVDEISTDIFFGDRAANRLMAG